MRKFLKIAAVPLLILLGYLSFWPVPIEPKAWNAPTNAGYVGDFRANNDMASMRLIDLGGYVGPEDLTEGPDGRIYMSTHSGVVAYYDPETDKVGKYVDSNGRILGLEFGPDGILYGADAYQGLVRFEEDGSETLLTNKTSDGSPIKYANSLDITSDGIIYFTDATQRFGAKENGGTLPASILDLMEHGLTGRVLKFDPSTGETSVVIEGLSFANGVSLTKDEKHLLVAETGNYSVTKFALDGSGASERILRNLPGFPDNLNRDADGSFWLGLASPRSEPVDRLSGSPFLRKVIMRLPEAVRPKPQRYGFIIWFEEDGEVRQTVQDPSGAYALTTGALTGANGRVYVSSLTEAKLGVLGP
ncbi:MAG: SMP-30/gluconolactonase/LRE family protein [Pseudomonadota bacterium]